jgi:mannose-6-phosphate isomerase
MVFKLDNEIKNYAWGELGAQSFIAQLLGIPVAESLPLAELWLGAHPSGSSMLVQEPITLQQKIKLDAQNLLGAECILKFGSELPFLLKVLSAKQALSIQCHPAKAKAIILHKQDPKNYPDAEAKEEIAIALDALTAIAGFLSPRELRIQLVEFPELQGFLTKESLLELEALTNLSPEQQSHWYAKNFSVFLNNVLSQTQLKTRAINSIQQKALIKKDLRSMWFLKLVDQYGDDDPGLLLFFWLNLLELGAGEALFLKPGLVHAYLQGNIVECMRNSDNVIRAGLTPKRIDVEALLDCADYLPGVPALVVATSVDPDELLFDAGAESFKIRRLQVRGAESKYLEQLSGPKILIVIQGAVRVVESETELSLLKGESCFVGHRCKAFTLFGQEDSVIYMAEVPL